MKTIENIVLLHAYSRRNSGDGLLVDLSAALLREAFGARLRLTVVAADPSSFPEYDDVLPAPVIAPSGLARVAAAAATACRVVTPAAARLRERLSQCDLIVGVGGGYLRARNGVEAAKLALGHLVQADAARAARKPTVYLPQSIGPALSCSSALSDRAAGRLREALAGFATVCVRDDRSETFLAGNANVMRMPDLAVLEFARSRDAVLAQAAARPHGVRHVALVLRDAPSWSRPQRERYAQSTRELIALLRNECRLSFAVQSTGRGNDDAAYYRQLGIGETLPGLRHLLEHDTPDVVVSVRLHGALESLLHGVPAFHLSYERKGFGAYGDLAIPRWVANAADFDASSVVQRLFAPHALPAFWDATERALARIAGQRTALIEILRHAAGTKTMLGHPRRDAQRPVEA
ncbi:polysaccharide pyruvyl transferase family protein [Caballeronia sp. LZ034LL]|uniref:polysaccharide pyruvyl transferase family protein n=1 Tax=Caballeronia sp. LZ034LL TaxID=3038567 RepID=UPI00285F255E|nr:polysaccharide pyruvyl transferase family protein [Caballeronia sp. LZ034LL]MDR5835157.1 polysaccharide pyruvyl transferase family protein [Caballeronia sp. LZ034LL]